MAGHRAKPPSGAGARAADAQPRRRASGRSRASPFASSTRPRTCRRAGSAARRGPDRAARRLPLHARDPRVDVPRAAVDDAPVRRLRHQRGDQRALPLPARPRPDRALDGVRHALADGPRLRPRALARRGRAARASRSTRSTTCRRCSAGIDLGEVSVSMTINAPAAIMLAFYVVAAESRPGASDAARAPVGDDPGRHPQGVHRPEGVVLPDRPGDAPVRRHDRVVHAAHAALAPDLDLRLPHPRGRLDRPAGARVHAQGRPHLRRAGGRARASTSTTSRRACRSSSTPRSTSSRRSPSTAPRGASGRASCSETFGAKNPRSWQMRFHAQTAGVSLTAQQPLNNIVRTADRGARRRCSAAPSRCTPTPTTRRSRCRPRRPSRSRCAPSR